MQVLAYTMLHEAAARGVCGMYGGASQNCIPVQTKGSNRSPALDCVCDRTNTLLHRSREWSTG